MHYPTYAGMSPPPLTCEEHIDSTFVSILSTLSYPGLEVQREDGSWMSVAPQPGSLILNIGDLLSRITDLKATRHRVQDIGRDRYSVPFFLEPRTDAKFEFKDSSTIMYGPWVMQRIRRFAYQFGHVPDFDFTT